jgi:hypothetical protein
MLLLVWLPMAYGSNCQSSLAPASINHYLYDATLKLSWAVVVDCRHPQRPATLIPVLPNSGLHSPVQRSGYLPAIEAIPTKDGLKQAPRDDSAGLDVVTAGSLVEIWKEGEVRIQLSGIAVQSAPRGGALMVRPQGKSVLLRGVARGANSVEIVGEGMEWGRP